jgi:cell wall-associated NlpC family hydrolase
MGDVLKSALLRTKAVDYLERFIGLPYVWGDTKGPDGSPVGGDDPLAGFDCSGLISETLQAVGLLPHRTRLRASQLYERFEAGAVERGYAGCLVFWYSGDKVVHVEMMIDDFHTIGASGGGSKTKTIEDAIRQNAFVKMRPLSYRGDRYLIADPFKVED